MSRGLVATVSVRINASVEKVWESLINPDIIKKYMFGTEVLTNWNEGSSIIWKGSWQGKHYEDKGVVIKIIPLRTLTVSHFSPLSGLPDKAENYHILVYELTNTGNGTILTLKQDNNKDETFRNHSQKNWEMMLQELQRILET